MEIKKVYGGLDPYAAQRLQENQRAQQDQAVGRQNGAADPLAGDKVALQVMVCPNDAVIQIDEQEVNVSQRKAMDAVASNANIREPLLSNRLEIKVTDEMLEARKKQTDQGQSTGGAEQEPLRALVALDRDPLDVGQLPLVHLIGDPDRPGRRVARRHGPAGRHPPGSFDTQVEVSCPGE